MVDADTPATARATLGAESASAPAATTTPAESGSPAKDDATLPSAAALAAEGIALPALRLELHAYGDDRASRFVFINGRRYLEGERLPEGPELLAIEPRGAVLRYAGHRFLLVPE
jgi:general secretion pathway protein B